MSPDHNVKKPSFFFEKKETNLSPSKVGSNDKLDVPIPKNPQYCAPHIPLSKSVSSFKELGSSLFLSSFVFGPRIPPVPTRLCMFEVLILPPLFIRKEPWKYEYGFDVQFFQDTKV